MNSGRTSGIETLKKEGGGGIFLHLCFPTPSLRLTQLYQLEYSNRNGQVIVITVRAISAARFPVSRTTQDSGTIEGKGEGCRTADTFFQVRGEEQGFNSLLYTERRTHASREQGLLESGRLAKAKFQTRCLPQTGAAVSKFALSSLV